MPCKHCGCPVRRDQWLEYYHIDSGLYSCSNRDSVAEPKREK